MEIFPSRCPYLWLRLYEPCYWYLLHNVEYTISIFQNSHKCRLLLHPSILLCSLHQSPECAVQVDVPRWHTPHQRQRHVFYPFLNWMMSPSRSLRSPCKLQSKLELVYPKISYLLNTELKCHKILMFIRVKTFSNVVTSQGLIWIVLI